MKKIENNWSITDVHDPKGNLYSLISVNKNHKVSKGEEISLTDLEGDHNICKDDLDCYNQTDLIFIYIAVEDFNQKKELLIRNTNKTIGSTGKFIQLILLHPKDTNGTSKKIKRTGKSVSDVPFHEDK